MPSDMTGESSDPAAPRRVSGAVARQRNKLRRFAEVHSVIWASAGKQLGIQAGTSDIELQEKQYDLARRILASQPAKPPVDLTTRAQSALNRRSKDASKKLAPRFDYPRPEAETELAAIQERASELTHVIQTVGHLGVEGVDTEVIQIAGLHEIGSRCEQLARDIGMHAVSEGRMTQIQLSRLIGVHELTVHRWVKALQEQQRQKPDDQSAEAQAQ